MNAFLWCMLNSCFPAPMFRIVNYKKFSFCDLLLSSLCIVLIYSGHLKYLKTLKLVVLYRMLCDWYQLASTGLHLLPKLLLINIHIHTIRNVLKREKNCCIPPSQTGYLVKLIYYIGFISASYACCLLISIAINL